MTRELGSISHGLHFHLPELEHRLCHRPVILPVNFVIKLGK